MPVSRCETCTGETESSSMIRSRQWPAGSRACGALGRQAWQQAERPAAWQDLLTDATPDGNAQRCSERRGKSRSWRRQPSKQPECPAWGSDSFQNSCCQKFAECLCKGQHQFWYTCRCCLQHRSSCGMPGLAATDMLMAQHYYAEHRCHFAADPTTACFACVSASRL